LELAEEEMPQGEVEGSSSWARARGVRERRVKRIADIGWGVFI
jgi:hypothetical protein